MTELSSTVEALTADYRARSRRRLLVVVLLLALMALSLVIDIVSGPSGMSIGQIVSILLDPAGADANDRVIVWDLRLPVALMALMVGAMLGIAGAEMQTILANPLADPFTLGISSAASFGAALAIVTHVSLIPGFGPFMVTVNAFVMSLVTAMLLFAFTRLRGVSTEGMVLVGIALMFSFNALLGLLQYGSTEVQLAQIVFWMMGSLARATWSKVAVCAAVLAVVVPWFMARNWSLTALRMGDEKAAALGVNVARLRIEMLVGVSLLASVAVSFVGTIAFVGLVGPHIARMAVGEDQRFFLPFAATASALLMSATSILSKTINPGVIYPIGMITSLIGIPFFVSLILGARRRNWQ
ncbi:iron ABC transporter permease [Amaricoccus sp.]|uniref:FecCD family ABC transporter permease n=1 Tax=Amaricoccus sp. TaxID=1872485 RepID=UPI00260C62BE|nr:iron ABC transporter permease [uncultured Amaricoccus sp.]